MRTHLVVGGRGGIGAAVVDRLTAAGDACIVLDRVDGHDACDPRSVAGVLEGVDRLDSLLLLAGSVGAGGIEDHDLDDWRRIIDDNLTSVFVCAKAGIPRLRRNSGGSIVVLTSVNGRSGGNNLSGPAYAAAKAGAIGLVRNLAIELAPDSIRVNGVAPGPVDTAMVRRLPPEDLETVVRRMQLRRVIEPDEVAAAVEFLISADARSITGATLDLNGGMWFS